MSRRLLRYVQLFFLFFVCFDSVLSVTTKLWDIKLFSVKAVMQVSSHLCSLHILKMTVFGGHVAVWCSAWLKFARRHLVPCP